MQIKQKMNQKFKFTLSKWVSLQDQTELCTSALHLAAFNGDINIVELCIENGAELTQQTLQGVNALHMAAQGNSPNIMHLLLRKCEGFDINQKDHSGANPLLWSSFCGSEISLTYILAQEDVDINAQNEKGQTALHLAINSLNSRKIVNITKRLLLKGADISIKDNKGRTPIEQCKKQLEKNEKL